MLRLIFLVMGLAIFAAACSDDSTPSQQEATDNFCEDLDAFIAGLQDLGTSVASLDRSRIQSSYDDLKKDFEDIEDSAADVKSSRSGELQSEFNDVKSAVDSLTQSGNLASGLTSLQTSLTTFAGTLSSLISEYNCQ